MSIYKTQNGREKSLELYDRQLLKTGKPFSDIYVKTSFGKTHIVEMGNSNETPLLVFHGGNSTSAYNLLMCRFLLEDFHIYAVDIIGHPGKSDEVYLLHTSEKDCLFPAKKVLSRAKRIFINCRTYELKASGHIHVLPQDIKNAIVDFLLYPNPHSTL